MYTRDNSQQRYVKKRIQKTTVNKDTLKNVYKRQQSTKIRWQMPIKDNKQTKQDALTNVYKWQQSTKIRWQMYTKDNSQHRYADYCKLWSIYKKIFLYTYFSKKQFKSPRFSHTLKWHLPDSSAPPELGPLAPMRQRSNSANAAKHFLMMFGEFSSFGAFAVWCKENLVQIRAIMRLNCARTCWTEEAIAVCHTKEATIHKAYLLSITANALAQSRIVGACRIDAKAFPWLWGPKIRQVGSWREKLQIWRVRTG